MDKLDLIDRRILAELRRDATQPIAQIAERVGLSQTPCWKRIQKLEQAGVITGRIAIVDPARIGLGLTAFVGIEAPDHSADWRRTFADAVAAMPEVMEVHRMAGEMDYHLRIVVADMAAYDTIYRRLTDARCYRRAETQFCATDPGRSWLLDGIASDRGQPRTGATRSRWKGHHYHTESQHRSLLR